jgi:hypothetical protein
MASQRRVIDHDAGIDDRDRHRRGWCLATRGRQSSRLDADPDQSPGIRILEIPMGEIRIGGELGRRLLRHADSVVAGPHVEPLCHLRHDAGYRRRTPLQPYLQEAEITDRLDLGLTDL